MSDWASRPMTADGATTDWELTAGSSFQDEDVQVRVNNDSANLYLVVRFRARDRKWAGPCAMTGLSVWLSPNGKKSQERGLRFAAGPSSESLPHPAEMSGRPGGRGLHSWKPRQLDGQLLLVDKKADTTAVLAADGSLGPGAGFACESGVCTYELSIPLRAADSGRFGIGAKPGGTVMVGLAAGPGKEEREAMQSQRPATPAGGMAGGPPGGGTRGGPPGGGAGGPGGGQRPAMDESPELWFEVRLASAAAAGPRR